MVEAERIGLSEELFWRMTPRQLGRAFAAAAARHRDTFEMATVTAYQAVSVYVQTMNKKRMPRFADLVRVAAPVSAASSPEHAQAALEIIAARMGGKVRPRTNRGESQ